MFEKVTAQVLSKVLSAYFVGINQSVTKSSIWNGDLVLNNLDIHPNIGVGNVEEISAKIHWRTSGKSKFTIKKLRLRLNAMKPRKKEEIIQSKLDHIDKLVMFKSTNQSYFTKFVKSVLEDLTCHISDITIACGSFVMRLFSVTLEGGFTNKSLQIEGLDLFWVNPRGEEINILSTNAHVGMSCDDSGNSSVAVSFQEPIYLNGSVALYRSVQYSLHEFKSVLLEEDRLLQESGIDFSSADMKKLGNEYISLYSQKLRGLQVWEARLLALTCRCPPGLIAQWRLEAQERCKLSTDNIFNFYECDEVADLPDFAFATFSVSFSLQRVLVSMNDLGLTLSSHAAFVRVVIAENWALEGRLKSIEMLKADTRIVSLQGCQDDLDKDGYAFEGCLAKKDQCVHISGSLHPVNFFLSPPLIRDLITEFRQSNAAAQREESWTLGETTVAPAGNVPVAMFGVTDYAPSVQAHVKTASAKSVSIDLTMSGPWLYFGRDAQPSLLSSWQAYKITAGHLRCSAPAQPLNDMQISIDITEFGLQGPDKEEIVPMIPLELTFHHKFEHDETSGVRYVNFDAKSRGSVMGRLSPASYVQLQKLVKEMKKPLRQVDISALSPRKSPLTLEICEEENQPGIETAASESSEPAKKIELRWIAACAMDDIKLSCGAMEVRCGLSFRSENGKHTATLARAILHNVFRCDALSITAMKKTIYVASSPLDFTVHPVALEQVITTCRELKLQAPQPSLASDVQDLTFAFAIDSVTLACLNKQSEPVLHFSAMGLNGTIVRAGTSTTMSAVLPHVRTWLPSGRTLFAPKCTDSPLLSIYIEQKPLNVCIDWAQVCILVVPEIFVRLGTYARETWDPLFLVWSAKPVESEGNAQVSQDQSEEMPHVSQDQSEKKPQVSQDQSEENAQVLQDNLRIPNPQVHTVDENWLRLNFGAPLLLIPTIPDARDITDYHGEEQTYGLVQYWRIDLGMVKITSSEFTLEGITVESISEEKAHVLVPTCGRCTMQWTPNSIRMHDVERPRLYINAYRVHLSEFFTILDMITDVSGNASPSVSGSSAFHFFVLADLTMDLGFTENSPLAHICVTGCSVESIDPLPLTISSTLVTIDDRRINSAFGRLVEIVHGAEVQIFHGTIWKVALNEPWIRLYPQLALDLSTIVNSALEVRPRVEWSQENGVEFIDLTVRNGKICLKVPDMDDFIAINLQCESDIQFTKRVAATTQIAVGVEMRLGIVYVRGKVETSLCVGRTTVQSNARLTLSPNHLICNVDKLSITNIQVRIAPHGIGMIHLGLKHSLMKDLPAAEPLEEILGRIPLEVLRKGFAIEMTVSAEVPCADICILDDRIICPFINVLVGLPLLTVGAYMRSGGVWDRVSLLAEQARAECSLANADNGLWEPFIRPLEVSVQCTIDRHGWRGSLNMEDRVEVLLTDTARTSLLGDFLRYAKLQIHRPFAGVRARICGGDVLVYNLTTELIEVSVSGSEKQGIAIGPGHQDCLWGRDERLRITVPARGSACTLHLRTDVYQSIRPGKDGPADIETVLERRRSTDACMSAFATRGTMYDGVVVFPQPSQKVIIVSPAVRLVNETDMSLAIVFKEREEEGRMGVVVHANVLTSELSSEDRQGERGNVVPPKCAFLPPNDAIKWRWSINGCEWFDPRQPPDIFRLADGRSLKLTQQRGPAHFVTMIVEPPMVLQSAIPASLQVKVSVCVPWIAYPDADTSVKTVSTVRTTLSRDDARKISNERAYSAYVHDRARDVVEYKNDARADILAQAQHAPGKTLYVSSTRKELVFRLKPQQAQFIYDPDLLYTPQVAFRFASRSGNWSSSTTLSADYGANDIQLALGNQVISIHVAKKKHKWTFLVEHWFVNATGLPKVRVLGHNLFPLPTLDDDISFVHIADVEGEAVMHIALGQSTYAAVLPVLNQYTHLKRKNAHTAAVLLCDRVDSTSTFGYVFSTVWTLCPPLAVHNDTTSPVHFGATLIDAKSVTTVVEMKDSFSFTLHSATPMLPMQVRPACYHLTIPTSHQVCSVEVCDQRGVAHISIRPPTNRVLVNYCRYVVASIVAQDLTYACPFGERVPFGLVNPFQNTQYVLHLKWIKPVECEIKAPLNLDHKWTRFFAPPSGSPQGFGVSARFTMLANGRKGKIIIRPQIAEQTSHRNIVVDVCLSNLFIRLVSCTQREVVLLSIQDLHTIANKTTDRIDIRGTTSRLQVDYYQSGNLPSCVLLYTPRTAMSLFSTTANTIDGGKVELGECQLGIDLAVFEEIERCLKPSHTRGLTIDSVLARAGVPYHLSIPPAPPHMPIGFSVRSFSISSITAKAYCYFNLKEREVFHPTLRALLKISNFGRQELNVDGANLQIPVVRINYRGSMESFLTHVIDLYHPHILSCWKTLFANSNAVLGGFFGRHFWDKRHQTVTQRRRSLLRVTDDGIIQ